MAAVEITLSDEAKAYVDAVVGDGDYADVSTFIEALVRADSARLEELRAEIQKGFDSGISPFTIEEAFEAGFDRARRKCA